MLADEGITVETTETLSADTAAGCDLVVVPHDETTTPAVDGVAAVERAVETVECPVVLYAVGFPGADVAIDALDAGAADAIYVPLERGELLARRVRCVATGEDGFADPAQLLEDFFEYYTEDIFIKDDTSRIAVGSNGTGQPQGYDREQLVGLTDYELLPPDLADALYEQEQRIRETGEPVVNAVEHFLQDGEDRWVATTKVPRYEDGEITGLVGGTRDVTHLRWRERLVARLHEASRDLMRAETTTDVCRVTTDIAADITALPAVQVVVHDGSLLTPADTDCGSVSLFADYERWFWRAFETGDPQYVTEGPEGESPTDLADPSTIDVAVFPLGDHGALGMRASEATFDEFTLDLANVLSATVEASLDRAEREAALRDHERELRLRNERLEEFAMMVSHDLRNPFRSRWGRPISSTPTRLTSTGSTPRSNRWTASSTNCSRSPIGARSSATASRSTPPDSPGGPGRVSTPTASHWRSARSTRSSPTANGFASCSNTSSGNWFGRTRAVGRSASRRPLPGTDWRSSSRGHPCRSRSQSCRCPTADSRPTRPRRTPATSSRRLPRRTAGRSPRPGPTGTPGSRSPAWRTRGERHRRRLLCRSRRPTRDVRRDATGIDDIAVTVADSADGVRPAAHDCCVVLHAPATPTLPAVDGLTLLDRLLDQGCPVPVAVYGHDIGDTEFTTRTFAKAVLDAGGIPMTMDPGRTELVARRIYHAVGRERHFQHDADLLDSLLDYFPHHIFIKDTAGRFAEASAVTAQEYDLAREELIGLTDYELLPRDHANDLYAEAQEILETGEPMVNKVEYYVDDDGQSHWVSTTKAPRYDADGTPIGIVGGTREVTEEKRQERMVRAIYEASRDLVRASDRAEIGEITVAIAEDIPALPRVQVALVDTSTGELAPVATDDTDIYDSYGDHYRTAFRDGQAQYIHTDGRVETDRETIAEPTAAVVPLGEHGALGVTTGEEAVDEFTLDLVTILAANVEAALDRAERERELEHQNERLEEFASIVSHDLRNPCRSPAPTSTSPATTRKTSTSRRSTPLWIGWGT
ncbi:PAS domain S-box protein [Halomicroarcula sp. GCM10025709]|uniref:PAS domain S-box protein n=1 Tax=Halomicroarcula sp. GCM10025709 TaxID=3252669 RepID=UPI00361879F0